MLPIERQNRIRELLHLKQSMKIADLSKELSVSEMTIHRDIKPLLQEDIIIKTFGGVTLAQNNIKHDIQNHCVYCSRSVDEKLSYRLILSNNKIERTCCAHCGLLRHRQLGDVVSQAICHDFLRDTTISALSAVYVMNTSLDIGCCQPQVLAFEWKEHASKFIHGFDGTIYTFEQAIEIVFKKMNQSI